LGEGLLSSSKRQAVKKKKKKKKKKEDPHLPTTFGWRAPSSPASGRE